MLSSSPSDFQTSGTFKVVSTPNPIPASFIRGGTSKGIFINRKHLPANRKEWDAIFLGIMGSPDKEYGRQLNGMGGGVSSLSKVMVVGDGNPDDGVVDIGMAGSNLEGSQVWYTFAQVGIKDPKVDYAGNCGNLSSVVGVFAVDDGLVRLSDSLANVAATSESRVKAAPGRGTHVATVSTFNTNTSKRIDTTFPVTEEKEGWVPELTLEEESIAGVPGKSSRIDVQFVEPGGALTGKLSPTGNPIDEVVVHIPIPGLEERPFRIKLSLVDATNPTVFVLKADVLNVLAVIQGTEVLSVGTPTGYDLLERIRQKGAEMMGLDTSAEAQPKIALLSHPTSKGGDLTVDALSMGVLHKAVPLTVGMCLGVAACIKGTIAHDIVDRSRANAVSSIQLEQDTGVRWVNIQHPSGFLKVGVNFNENGDVESAGVIRTGRRLMRGFVYWK